MSKPNPQIHNVTRSVSHWNPQQHKCHQNCFPLESNSTINFARLCLPWSVLKRKITTTRLFHNMYIYIYTYIHTCIHTYIHTYIYRYTYIRTYTYTYRHIHTYIHTCMHTYTHIDWLARWPLEDLAEGVDVALAIT